VVYPLVVSGLQAGASLQLLSTLDKRAEFLRYGLPMVPSLLALWLVSQSDRLVLSHFVAKSDLGIYAFAASLSAYMVFIGYAVYPLLLPQASKLYDEGNIAAVGALLHEAQDVFILLWAGGMIFLSLWSVQIITWTGGNAFVGAAPAFLILCFSAGFDQLMGIYQYIFHLVKRTGIILWLHLGYAAIIVTGLAYAGFAFGIAGVPWAVLGAAIIFNIVRYRIAIRYLSFPVNYGMIMKVVSLAAAAFLVAYFAANWNIGIRVAATIFVAAGLAVYLFRRKWRPGNEAVSWI
jgi:O-antigen/teichoic acid export membrane protein